MPIMIAVPYRTYEALLVTGKLAALVEGLPCPP
jgi:hypothetical protein